MRIGRRGVLGGAPALVFARSGRALAAARSPRFLALVVGIDDYPHIPKLKGCINDATGIARAIDPFASRLVTLFNAEASRKRFLAVWDGYIQEAEAGDQIFISYAGHGSEVPELVKGSKADGLERVVRCYDFDQDMRNDQRIIDGEFGARLSAASRKQVTTWLVADSCYAGGLTRSADPRANAVIVRSHHVEMHSDMLADLVVPATPPGAQTNIVFLAGALEDETVKEFKLGGEQHGALSFSFANAVRRAGTEGDATVNDFVQKVVAESRQRAEGQHHPFAISRTNGEAAVFRLPGHTATAQAPAESTVDVIRVFVLPGRLEAAVSAAMTDAIGGVAGVAVASRREDADLVLDTAKGEMIAVNGDVLASELEASADPEAIGKLKGALSKAVLIRRLAGIPSAKIEIGLVSPRAALAAGGTNSRDQRHPVGERLDVVVRPLLRGDLIVLSVDAWGEVVVLRPLGGGQMPLNDVEWRLAVQVTGPKGAGHVVAIFSTDMPAGLVEQLKRLEGRPGGGGAAMPLLVAAANEHRVQLAVLGFFS